MNRYGERDGFCAVAALICCLFVFGLMAVAYVAIARDVSGGVHGELLNAPKVEARGAPLEKPVRVIPNTPQGKVDEVLASEKAKDAERFTVTFAALGGLSDEIPSMDFNGIL